VQCYGKLWKQLGKNIKNNLCWMLHAICCMDNEEEARELEEERRPEALRMAEEKAKEALKKAAKAAAKKLAKKLALAAVKAIGKVLIALGALLVKTAPIWIPVVLCIIIIIAIFVSEKPEDICDEFIKLKETDKTAYEEIKKVYKAERKIDLEIWCATEPGMRKGAGAR